MKTITITCSIEVTGDAPDEINLRNAIDDAVRHTPGCQNGHVKIIDVDREDGRGPVVRG